MNPKLFWLITAIFLLPIYRVEAQQPKLPTIGWLAVRPGFSGFRNPVIPARIS
jgi:hypothetical protein